jgi:UDP-3-O-[3-hydroxymyristoyl] glucosamine N-acyltransferase
MRVSEIAHIVNGEVVGDADREIYNVQKIEEAGNGDISFIANPKYVRYVDATKASALLVGHDFDVTRSDITYIRTEDPYMAFLKMLRVFAPVGERPAAGVHPTAVISEDVEVGEAVSIGAYVVIGPGSVIGNGAVIYPHVVMGAKVMVGSRSILYPNVSLYSGVQIGNDTIIHAGTVIGADGFGFAPTEDGIWEKIPQIGTVVIEDNVEIGANVTIDRATLGVTRICSGVKLDNLIHIAHNVVIGRNTVIAAQTGISGSTRVGESNMIAGQVGMVGHIETASNVIIEAQSGVSKSIRSPGRYFGHPVKEHTQALRQEGALRQLPDLLRDIRDLRQRLEHLEDVVGKAEEEAME